MRRARQALFAVACASTALAGACATWDPERPFEREAPAVRDAIRELGDGGDAAAASKILEDYLTTGPCTEGNIGTPDMLRRRPNGGFDLGLALFRIAEGYGARFGEEETQKESEASRALRAGGVECALKVVRSFAADESAPLETRVRARYLEGNLLFLDRKYKEAVGAYDKALGLSPGMSDAGDPVGRDAAWNRAIALRREEEKNRDAGQDGSRDAASEASDPDGGDRDAGQDGGGKDGGGDSGQDDKKDGGANDPKDGGTKDAGQDGASPPPKDKEDGGKEPPPPKSNQDDRMLDQLENAPTVQQEAARKQAQKHKVRGTADK